MSSGQYLQHFTFKEHKGCGFSFLFSSFNEGGHTVIYRMNLHTRVSHMPQSKFVVAFSTTSLVLSHYRKPSLPIFPYSGKWPGRTNHREHLQILVFLTLKFQKVAKGFLGTGWKIWLHTNGEASAPAGERNVITAPDSDSCSWCLRSPGTSVFFYHFRSEHRLEGFILTPSYIHVIHSVHVCPSSTFPPAWGWFPS